MNSTELRARLRDLELAYERTGSAVVAAETAHAAAIRRAVLTNDHETAEQTQSVLRAAEREHSRTADMLEQARQLLAQTVKHEREAVQDVARTEIEAELAEMGEAAAEIDTAFAALVERVLQLREREHALRLKTRKNFREVWGAPEFLPALRSLASFLTATANGIQPDAPVAVSKAARSGAHSIKRAINDV